MKRRMREIVALGLLLVLGLGAVGAMGWYILAGHGWNVTASNIDDSIGQMEGYTVVLFEGTRPLPVGSQALLQEAGGMEPASNSLQDGSTEAAEEPRIDDEGDPADEPRDLESLSQSYWEKGADVYRIALDDRQRYREPMVLSKGQRRLGVCGLEAPTRLAQARVAQKLLARQKSDFNLLIAPDTTLEGLELPGVQVVLCDGADIAPFKAHYSGSVYWVAAPYVNQAQALIISPSGVLSTKVIDLA